MKIVKQLANKIKLISTGVSTFIPTQLSFWYGGQYVTNQTMHVFSQDIYEKLALLTTNVNKFPAVIFSDGGISKFKVTDDKRFIDVPALACAFYISTTQGNNLPYKPYVIGYTDKQKVLISVGTITEPLYVRANLVISNIDENPTNVPTTMKLSVTQNDVNSCLLCIIYPDGSIDFSQTNFLVNSAVNTIADNTELLNAKNNFNAITPSSLSLFSNLGHVDAFDIRVLQNGGYAKDRVIREYDTTGYWVYYQSLIDNNTNPKPTLASHVGWGIVTCYQNIFQPYITNKVYKISEYLNTDHDTFVIYMKYLGNNNAKLFGRYSFRADSVGSSNISLRSPDFPNHYDDNIWGGAIQYSSLIIDESKNLALSIILNNSVLEISRSGNLLPSNFTMNTRFSLDVVFTD